MASHRRPGAGSSLTLRSGPLAAVRSRPAGWPVGYKELRSRPQAKPKPACSGKARDGAPSNELLKRMGAHRKPSRENSFHCRKLWAHKGQVSREEREGAGVRSVCEMCSREEQLRSERYATRSPECSQKRVTDLRVNSRPSAGRWPAEELRPGNQSIWACEVCTDERRWPQRPSRCVPPAQHLAALPKRALQAELRLVRCRTMSAFRIRCKTRSCHAPSVARSNCTRGPAGSA